MVFVKTPKIPPKTLFLAHFWHFSQPSDALALYYQNQATPLFLLDDFLTSCQKAEKTDQPFLGTCVTNQRKDRQANRRTQMDANKDIQKPPDNLV